MWYNPFMVWLLYSPLHWILSANTMVVNYTGRKSGIKYRVPAGYIRSGDILLTTSFKPRKWWRNLRGGAEVTVRLQGKDVRGHAEVIEDEQGVMEGIRTFVGGSAVAVRMLGLKMDPGGQIDEASLKDAASNRMIVETRLV